VASYEELASAVISGKEAKVKDITETLLDAGADPLEIIDQGLIAGMNVVGMRFKDGEMYVPEVLMAARSMNAGMELVKPHVTGADLTSPGKIIIGTVRGDLHDIGKNLVAMMMESAGFTVINLGVDIAPEVFLQAFKEHKPNIVAMSALLTTTMLSMKETIEVFEEEGLRDKVKIIVGGAPVSLDFAEEIGADGYAPDAASASDLCKQLIN
jgi:5-methyltetrahydrofolate--homocysteine methyltransferase